MEKLNVQGQCQTVNPDSPTIEIPLPQLPFTGAWSVSGTILAFDNDASSPANADSVALLLFISGNSVGGTALRNDGATTPYTMYPATGGLAVSVSVGIGTASGTTQSLYLTLDNAVEGSTVAWGWDLDILFLNALNAS